MGLGKLERAPSDQSGSFHEQVERLIQLAKDTLNELRRLTVALRPAALDELGLVPAIGRYADMYLGEAGVDFHMEGDIRGWRLEPSLEAIVYRVVQEAINNVGRHSGATQVKIGLHLQGDTLVATVEDNGRGFDPVVARDSMGLRGMQERASLAGGRLTIESQLGHGTTVRLEIPLAQPIGAARDG
jgi:signal transduction histidine kinase